MSFLFTLLLLAATWVLTLGPPTPAGWGVGLIAGAGVAIAVRARTVRGGRAGTEPAAAQPSPWRGIKLSKLWQGPVFAAWVTLEVLKANVAVALAVLRPVRRLRPGVLGIPLEPLSAAEITLLANIITLTPGTLSLDVSSDRRTLYVHFLHVGDEDAMVADIKRRYERRVMELLR